MKRRILKQYLFALITIILFFISIHISFLVKLNSLHIEILGQINSIKNIYYEIRNFEDSYIKEQNKGKLNYIERKYEDFDDTINDLNSSLTDRDLKFYLSEIKEIMFKHKESFLRAIIYVRDINYSSNNDLYQIESYNLQKSLDIFYKQNLSFDERTEKFTKNLNRFINEEKIKREKLIFTLLLGIVIILTLALKYKLIWGESYGYFNKAEKSEN